MATNETERRLDTAIEAHPARSNLCGVLRVSRGGSVLIERAYGHASVQLGVPNRPDTRFHIASVTKAFISAAVVRRIRDGSLSVHDHPSKYVAELAAIDSRITLHHLLTHTAGLADVYAVPNVRVEMAALVAGNRCLLDYLAALPQERAPGSAWRYSTTGFLLLGYVLERIGGVSFEMVLRETLLDPLGLADTGVDDVSRVNHGRASGHAVRDGVWRNTPNDPLADIDAPRELYSTAADLDRFATALLDGRILDAEGVALTFTPHANIGPGGDFDPSLNYGYGWFLGPNYRWIGGMTDGFRASLWQYPRERLNVVMLWNNEAVDSYRVFAELRPILLD
jgi:CubicO group peptidase (beta-lactamase class C family)